MDTILQTVVIFQIGYNRYTCTSVSHFDSFFYNLCRVQRQREKKEEREGEYRTKRNQGGRSSRSPLCTVMCYLHVPSAHNLVRATRQDGAPILVHTPTPWKCISEWPPIELWDGGLWFEAESEKTDIRQLKWASFGVTVFLMWGLVARWFGRYNHKVKTVWQRFPK